MTDSVPMERSNDARKPARALLTNTNVLTAISYSLSLSLSFSTNTITHAQTHTGPDKHRTPHCMWSVVEHRHVAMRMFECDSSSDITHQTSHTQSVWRGHSVHSGSPVYNGRPVFESVFRHCPISIRVLALFSSRPVTCPDKCPWTNKSNSLITITAKKLLLPHFRPTRPASHLRNWIRIQSAAVCLYAYGPIYTPGAVEISGCQTTAPTPPSYINVQI